MPSSSVEENIYDVEKIVKDRVINGKVQYLIKWVGYPESENTWEYEDNVLSKDLIREYKESKKLKTKSKRAKKAKFEINITNEWENRIKEILSVFRDNDSNLQVIYLNKDNTKGLAPAVEMHTKAPLKLLKFYEENIYFSN